MGQLLKEPVGPVVSLFYAFGATLGTVGAPVLVRVFFFAESDATGWVLVVSFLLIMALVAGVFWAVRSLLQKRAYDRLTGRLF